MAQLCRLKGEFDAVGARVLLVGMGSVDQTADFVRELAVPFSMACDPERRIYKALGLKRFSPLGFLSPTLAVKGLTAMAKGHIIGVPQGDILQLAGVFIIDSQGVIIFRHAARDPSDHPEAGALVDFLKDSPVEAM